ncbi:membrane protein [Bacteroidales bacterium]|nr:membrane protein [Bacteroidales bacterium]
MDKRRKIAYDFQSKKMMLQEAKDLVNIAVGLVFYAVGWTGFLLPSEITTGGVTGIGALIYYAKGIPVEYSYFIINAFLLLFSIKIFGLKFSLRTIFSVFVLTLLLSFFGKIFQEPIVVGEPFMSCILGGVLCGIGIGIVFSAGGSTGGTDIIALVISKYRNMRIGKSMLISDVIIICSSYMIFQSVEKIVYGLVVMGVMTYTVDLVFNGTRQSVQFLIFSEKYDEIATAINQQIGRGCTIIQGQGWYSQKEVKVIILLAKKGESTAVFRLIKQIDDRAFISQSSVVGVYGEGFDEIKA